MSCKYCAEPLEGVFYDIVRGLLSKTENDTSNDLFHSFWFLVRKTDRVVVGSCDFKNVPDENHGDEIGYGLGKEFEGSGHMAEAIHVFCKWALAQEDISHVIAETENENSKPENVLKRVGLTRYKQSETTW